MRILFTEEVLSDADLWTELDRILGTVDDGWHLWEIPDPDAVEESPWFKGGRPQHRELFETAARRLVWQGLDGPHQKRVVVLREERGDEMEAAPPDLSFPARTARRFLGEPLRILMENTESDGIFLDAVFDVLGPAELRDLRACEPPALCYDSPGGHGELPKRINRYIEDPAWRDVPRRLFVLTDSDGLVPNVRGSVARKVADHCEEHEIPYCVLRKRSIENYLPQEALDAWAALPKHTSARAKVAALARLDEDQRNHFHMKKGFTKEYSEELFSPSRISEEDRRVLAEGFRDLVDLLQDHRSAVTPQTLRQRCGVLREEDEGDGVSTELDKLIIRICAEL